MSKNSKIALYSVLASVLFIAFFYFYPATIFEANITERGLTYSQDVSLKAFLDYSQLPQVAVNQNVSQVSPTWKGGVLLLVCLIGVPIMLGYRAATNNQTKAGNKNTKK